MTMLQILSIIFSTFFVTIIMKTYFNDFHFFFHFIILSIIFYISHFYLYVYPLSFIELLISLYFQNKKIELNHIHVLLTIFFLLTLITICCHFTSYWIKLIIFIIFIFIFIKLKKEIMIHLTFYSWYSLIIFEFILYSMTLYFTYHVIFQKVTFFVLTICFACILILLIIFMHIIYLINQHEKISQQ